MEEHPEEPQRPGDAAGEVLGVLDRVELGSDLADDALGDSDQQVGDDHRDCNRRRVPETVAEQGLEDVGDGRLAESTDADRGHRDPDLAGGDVVADLLELHQRHPRPALAVLGHRLQAPLAGAHERVLRDHEERVDQDQKPGEDDEERFHPCALRRLVRPRASARCYFGMGRRRHSATRRTVAAGSIPGCRLS